MVASLWASQRFQVTFLTFSSFPLLFFPSIWGGGEGEFESAGTWNGRSRSNLLSGRWWQQKEEEIIFSTFSVFLFSLFGLLVWCLFELMDILTLLYPCHCYLGLFGSGVQQHTQRDWSQGETGDGQTIRWYPRRRQWIVEVGPQRRRRRVDSFLSSPTPITSASNVFLFLAFLASCWAYGSRCCCSAKINTAGNTAICLRATNTHTRLRRIHPQQNRYTRRSAHLLLNRVHPTTTRTTAASVH